MKKFVNNKINVTLKLILNIKKIIILAFWGVLTVNNLYAATMISSVSNAKNITELTINGSIESQLKNYKEKNNNFFLVYGPGVNSLELSYLNSTVSNGQLHENNFSSIVDCQSNCDHEGTKELRIDFQAGRKPSAAVADSFYASIDNKSSNLQYAFGKNGIDIPTNANFFITTKLYINDSRVINDFYLAQSDALLSDPWWIGTKKVEEHCPYGLVVRTENGRKYYIGRVNKPIYEDPDSFQIADFSDYLKSKCPENTNPLWENHYNMGVFI